MDRIFFENVRCFAARQEVRLAPLTVLVGENSSGKSTFLALVRLAWDLVSAKGTVGFPDFNEEPFQLGAFDQIVSRASRSERRTFIIGIGGSVDMGERSVSVKVVGDFRPLGGQPVLGAWTFESAPYEMIHRFETNGQGSLMTVSLPSGEFTAGQPPATPLDEFFIPASLIKGTARGEHKEQARELEALTDRLRETVAVLKPRPYAFAPVRTRPRRTYDPVQPLESPEGSHIPIILANTFRRDPEEWSKIATAMEFFGRQSGLFDRVEVRRLGKLESDPFQIQVRIGGNAINLIDVGYGVSQVLPIIVDCLRGERRGTFLLQQPEVHLHPSAQAELGSFLGVLAKEQDKRFVIETHSDYLVDRIRMDIRDRKGITPEDVSLLYFERRNGEAHIHSLMLDNQGNILDPPPGYRSFFLEEERRFLGG
jgi:predicted ATPase